DIAVFLVVVVLAGFIIPQILLIAFRKNLFDEVDPRKIHKGAVPRLGGIAFFPAILFAMLLIFGVCRQFCPSLMDSVFQSSLTGLCFIACAVIILYLVGMADDLIGLKYRAKFMAQIVSAALVVVGGIYIDNLHGFLWVGQMHIGVAVLLTILLTVFITNSINLIDGIDGLASGLSAIACAFYGVVFFKAGLHIYGMLAFAALGALVPFFYYNVFGNAHKHSKISMGDTGALTIGLILSTLSIRITQISDSVLVANSAVMAFAPLLIPCFDVVRVYIHRIKAHRNPFLPDKSHIHHKLLALGMSQRVAMPSIVVASLLLTLFNYWCSAHVNITLLFALDITLWIVANIILSRAIRRKQRVTNVILYE
ncbi:MAG: undecaprenyl/decaprenyl-phosphate alpha-N-acetylglucosaminyl 1-phosphate transferase, partial [Muribaculaceae bacterium]|nr:undecaprenyl/decaprenyl-phosphate alpha-N-acetylglucosaminyl 1-phosphate transferase [Muribaculaceae bacterium]